MIGQFATEEERAPLARFMEENGIRFSCAWRRADERDGWKHDVWSCTFRRTQEEIVGVSRASLTVTFRMGMGHQGHAPTPESVLSCLADDAAGWENCRGPEEFMREYGYESYREAVRTYRAVDRQSRRLLAFLGEDAYQDLLWNTERE